VSVRLRISPVYLKVVIILLLARLTQLASNVRMYNAFTFENLQDDQSPPLATETTAAPLHEKKRNGRIAALMCSNTSALNFGQSDTGRSIQGHATQNSKLKTQSEQRRYTVAPPSIFRNAFVFSWQISPCRDTSCRRRSEQPHRRAAFFQTVAGIDRPSKVRVAP